MNRLFRWGVIFALFILIGSGVMAVKMVFVDDGDADVPDVVGMTAVDATNALQLASLVSRIDVVNSDQPEGTVISQSPRGGAKIGRGKTVVVRVSKGGAQLRMPDVRGKDFAAAVKELDTAGLKIGTVLRVPDKMRSHGTVIAQNPAAPAMVPGDRMVELLVSEGGSGGSDMVQIPDLKGQTERLARQIVEQSSLSVSRIITVESNQVPEGTVLRTQPIAGSRVPNGNAIILYLAKAMPEGSIVEGPEISTTPPNARTEPAPSQQQPPQLQAPQQAQTQPQAQSAPAPAPSAPPQPVMTQPVPAQPAQQPAVPVQQQTAPAPAPPATPSKTAKIRYQIPPLTRPLRFKVTITDDMGTRVLREQEARGGEYITMDIGYTGTATVAVQLDNETVWQERYR